MTIEKIRELIAQMTLEEKASLCSGADFWHTKAVERLGVPAVMVSDGPHGLRKQDEEGDHLGVNDSIKAVCFPAGCATASSFNRDLMFHLGEVLGNECQAEGVSVLLGPAVNIKRSPLCGRNFEYYSEDPFLAGEIAASYINGVQSKHVGTSIKHFMANNQETRRMSVDATISERAIREIYLPAFEDAVKKAQPWTIMSSYNKVNGEYVGDSHRLLTEILRDEWGFEGLVVSDWGAVNDRVKSVAAGLDLEMPSSGGMRDAQIVAAVKNQELAEADLDLACERILSLVYKYTEHMDSSAVFDRDADHEEAKKAAEETIVLLKNEGKLLPLDAAKKVAFIGKYAQKPRFQGGGSSHINCAKVTSALDAVAQKGLTNVTFAKGFDDEEDVIDEKLVAEAVEIAKAAEVAVIFAGLPDAFESEGFDRSHMNLPNCQNHLIEEILKVQKNTVIVLHNGSPVEMPWVDEVRAILEAYLSGEGVGAAEAAILFGDVNPSAKLAETFPVHLEDNPSYLTGFGEGDYVNYAEDIFVGYRYYEKKKLNVLFPFGHGLSYTEFAYSNLSIEETSVKDTDTILVSIEVTNVGSRAGKEVVQLYVGDDTSTLLRPVKELKGFEKISLEPGETKTVTFELDARAFAYYEPKIGDWNVETGDFTISVGSSSADIAACAKVHVEGTKKVPVVYTPNTTCGDLPNDPEVRAAVKPFLEAFGANVLAASDEATDAAAEAMSDEMNRAMLEYMPIRALISFANGGVSPEMVKELVDKLNQNR